MADHTPEHAQESAENGPAIESIALGPFETNCYIVRSAEKGDPACWIVDAGMDPGAMIERIEEEGLQPAALLLTHAHADHIAGLGEIKRRWPEMPVRIHPAEASWLNDPVLNLSAGMGVPITAPAADGALEEGQAIELLGQRWRVLHTPGHSPGGVTLHCEAAGVAFVGDTLFAGSIGRHDFPTSDAETLFDSIRRLYTELPDDTVVLPGHGPPTTIGREKKTNPFVRG